MAVTDPVTETTHRIEDDALHRELARSRSLMQLYVVQEAYGVRHTIVARNMAERDAAMSEQLGIDLVRDRYAVYRQGPDGSILVSGNDRDCALELKAHLRERFGIIC